MDTINHTDNRLAKLFLTAKKEIIENRKAILLGVGSYWGLCLMIGALLGYKHMGGGLNMVVLYNFIFCLVAALSGSCMFGNMKTKEGRISTLLLPASTFDKFFVRWAAFVPILFLISLAGFYINEMARILTYWAFNGSIISDNYSKVTDIWKILNSFGGLFRGNLFLSFGIISYFFSQSFFIFGAILWPKLSFLKTFATMWVIETLLGIILMTCDLKFSINTDNITIDSLIWTFCGFEIAVTIALYVLTYIRFKRSQVVYKLF